jgi:hypothetical protein
VFFSFPKKEFLLIRNDSQCSQSGDVLTRAVLDLDNGCTLERVCTVKPHGCVDERVYTVHLKGCETFMDV